MEETIRRRGAGDEAALSIRGAAIVVAVAHVTDALPESIALHVLYRRVCPLRLLDANRPSTRARPSAEDAHRSGRDGSRRRAGRTGMVVAHTGGGAVCDREPLGQTCALRRRCHRADPIGSTETSNRSSIRHADRLIVLVDQLFDVVPTVEDGAARCARGLASL